MLKIHKYVFNLLFTIYVFTKMVLNTVWTILHIEKRSDFLLAISSLIIAIPILPISLILLAAGWIYRQILHIILILTLGDQYMGLMTGCNVIATLDEEEEQAVVTIIFNIDSDKNENDIFSSIKLRLEDIMKSKKYAKLFTVRKMFMGFIYLQKYNFHIDEILAFITEEFQEFMNKHCHRDMPQLNKGNFDVYVSRERCINGGYPIVFRIHHCLADGLAVYSLLSKLFFIPNNTNENYGIQVSDRIRKNTKKTVSEYVEKFRSAQISSIIPKTCQNDIFSERNNNGSKTILTFAVESEEKSIPTIKRIKKRFPNMHFNAILYTAISASLAEFYIKKREVNEIPETIHTSMMAQVNHHRFKMAYDTEEDVEMSNDFSILYPQLIVVPKELREKPIEEYIVDRLFLMHKEYNRTIESAEYITNYTMFTTIAEVLPICLLKLFYSLGKLTVAFSSMPGGPTRLFITRDIIQDMVFFVPKQPIMGLCLTILTYDNKLQLGLKASRNKCNNIQELDEILKGVYKYIDILDQKTANY